MILFTVNPELHKNYHFSHFLQRMQMKNIQNCPPGNHALSFIKSLEIVSHIYVYLNVYNNLKFSMYSRVGLMKEYNNLCRFYFWFSQFVWQNIFGQFLWKTFLAGLTL